MRLEQVKIRSKNILKIKFVFLMASPCDSVEKNVPIYIKLYNFYVPTTYAWNLNGKQRLRCVTNICIHTTFSLLLK